MVSPRTPQISDSFSAFLWPWYFWLSLSVLQVLVGNTTESKYIVPYISECMISACIFIDNVYFGHLVKAVSVMFIDQKSTFLFPYSIFWIWATKFSQYIKREDYVLLNKYLKISTFILWKMEDLSISPYLFIQIWIYACMDLCTFILIF